MINNIYDNKEFFAEYKELRVKDGSYNNLVEQPAMQKLLPNLKNKVVLDIGCGSGVNCKQFSQMGAKKIVGVDISKNMLNLAKENNNAENIDYQILSIENLSKLKQKFSFVYSSLAIHYVADYSKVFYDVNKLLKKNGEFLLSMENPVKTAKITEGDSGWHKDENGVSKFYELSYYLDDGKRTTDWCGKKVVKYHHSFSSVINAIVKNGFLIEECVEPLPIKGATKLNPKMTREHHAPCFVIFKLKKYKNC